MVVSEVMTPDPVTLDVAATLRDAVSLRRETDTRHLPIVEDDRLVGVISDRDIASAAADVPSEGPSGWLDAAVSSIMSSDVKSVAPEDDIADAIDLMVEHRIGAVPVVEDEESKLVGIISYVDVLRAARDVL